MSEPDAEVLPTRTCIRCKQTKTVWHFTRDGKQVDGWQRYCRACQREKQEERRVRNGGVR